MEDIKYLLKELGLTEYETKAYLSLLQLEKSITAYKLSKICGVPFGRIYDIMDNLVSKGIVILEPGKPKRFKAIEPKIAVSALLTKKDVEWQQTKIKIKDIVNKLQRKITSEEPVTMMKGKEVLLWKILEIYSKAKKEVLIIAGTLGAKRKGIDLGNCAREGIKKGVKFKMIIPSVKEVKQPIKELVKVGIDIREYPIKGIRFSIIDEKLCFLSIEDQKFSYKTATIIVESEIFSKAMKEFFNGIWEKARVVKK
ncbi:hypothetical protein CEE44_05280 [Candidatus Woesearchaeota archaeon B3_Woes]|nr:MAG: hypothetical protein CEE44_05280 [Candidatus Woesearchaeota archaeon B3_Woes]